MTDFSNKSITELATLVAHHLQQQGIDVVLVGGLAVEIYTDNVYLTKDIDMVNVNYQKPERLHQAMAEIGFYKHGRVYVNQSTDITIEFPSGPLSVGDELIAETAVVDLQSGSIPILSVEDVVKDRLAAFIHWQDRQSLIQAVCIMLNHQLSAKAFSDFCTFEGKAGDYELLQALHDAAIKSKTVHMKALEDILSDLLLSKL